MPRKPAGRGRVRPLPGQAGGCDGTGKEAKDHRHHLYRHLPGGVRQDRRRIGREVRISVAGNPVSRRHRIDFVQGTVRNHQNPPQRWRSARFDAPETDRADEGVVQGRGPGIGNGHGNRRKERLATPLPGSRTGHSYSGRGHAGAREDSPGGRRDCHRGVVPIGPLPKDRTGLCGPSSVQDGRCHGRLSNLRERGQCAMRRNHGLYDGGLLPPALRRDEHHEQPCHQRGSGHQSTLLLHCI
mmetsp:Transcript_8150/g.15840  ORF Transcript_8150/g.15840 Transcript_8150/m.15840 type:complete len:241 (+) Transcript_8150:1048-1770(+)